MGYKNENKILLILDLDETLVYATDQQIEGEADFSIFDFQVFKRPFLLEFLNEIKSDFLIAIWSSASDDSVEEVVKQIIPENLKLEFVWGRSRCSYRRNIIIDENGYYDSDPSNHHYYIKPLKKLKRQGYDLNKILIVDDSPHKSKDNYCNAIYPKAFMGDPDDMELKFLSKYLRSLKNKENVRSIEKRNWRSQSK